MIGFLKPAGAFLVLLIANLALFGGVAWNRSGTPTAVVAVSQCDFWEFFNSDKERTTLRYLNLDARSLNISKERNAELSLPALTENHLYGNKWRNRRAFVLMAFGGVEWDRYLASRPDDENLQWYPQGRRLLTDGAFDAPELLARMPDDGRHAIMPGFIETRYFSGLKRGSVMMQGSAEAHYAWGISHRKISIDSAFRPQVRAILDSSPVRAPSAKNRTAHADCQTTHRIVLKWGRRYEPWIDSIETATAAH